MIRITAAVISDLSYKTRKFNQSLWDEVQKTNLSIDDIKKIANHATELNYTIYNYLTANGFSYTRVGEKPNAVILPLNHYNDYHGQYCQTLRQHRTTRG